MPGAITQAPPGAQSPSWLQTCPSCGPAEHRNSPVGVGIGVCACAMAYSATPSSTRSGKDTRHPEILIVPPRAGSALRNAIVALLFVHAMKLLPASGRVCFEAPSPTRFFVV